MAESRSGRSITQRQTINSESWTKKPRVLEALSDWNPWWKTGKVDDELKGKRRGTAEKFSGYLDFRELKVLVGVRRSGKSTLFYQFIDMLLEKITPNQILLINFEDDVLSKQTLRQILDVYQSEINPGTKPYIFLDEVHRCPEWALFLRKLYDLRQVGQVFITDSSSKFIKSEYAGTITGRNISLTAFPLSFAEYAAWMGVKFDAKLASRTDANKMKNELKHYLKWGGFPEVFMKTSKARKKILLTEYLGDIVHKDIVERYNVDYSKIKPLVDYITATAGNLFSPRKYSRRYGLSLESINTYLKYLEEVFLIFAVPKFDYSITKQHLSPKKMYLVDTGFMNNVGFRFSENLGSVLENAVFIELKRRGKEVYYWKNKNECDFLVKEGLKIREAIQASLGVGEENEKREIDGLLDAMDAFRLKEGLVITGDSEDEEERHVGGKTIKIVPLWKWLLDAG